MVYVVDEESHKRFTHLACVKRKSHKSHDHSVPPLSLSLSLSYGRTTCAIIFLDPLLLLPFLPTSCLQGSLCLKTQHCIHAALEAGHNTRQTSTRSSYIQGTIHFLRHFRHHHPSSFLKESLLLCLAPRRSFSIHAKKKKAARLSRNS